MTVTGPGNAPDVVDVVALGESMVTFLPSRSGRLADVPSFYRGIGGAESNVACVLAAVGHSARWVSRVGADGFGDHLIETIGGYGVDVSSVTRDPARPTGVYFRTAGDRATDAHEVAYYRAGSAASVMSVGNVDLGVVRTGRILHLSGITAALSEGCLDLLRELTAPGEDRPVVSFDVNHRPGLWPDADGPHVLLELARNADIVFVGEDEAEEAWNIKGGPTAIRALLPEPATLVVKQGASGATLFERTPPHLPQPHRHGPAPQRTPGAPTDTTTFAPALHVDVVAAVGAGDAFAAGFLSATLRALPARARLRHGHLMAAATLTTPGDLAAPPPTRHPTTAPHGASPRAERLGGPPPRRTSWIDHADRLAALDDDAWGRLRLGPGWTQADQAPEEVRTR
ncbi:sugar kinase [Streptomyces capitiformicae]|uniref:Carbohydrate kinase n=1 Tax=Streptomyces capitiformicae TaxID=2014920 RepID=A0A918Z1E0_9ACTN|nr:sugar kinase [Streptomyces capitiformicae]GHE33543.1 carbohydrate kinase [Streptomyces capitiformicae]